MRTGFALGALALLGACGNGSGACEKQYEGTYVAAEWCHDFHDEAGETGRTGEEICAEIGGAWTAGQSCADLGYTYECGDNEWYQDGC